MSIWAKVSRTVWAKLYCVLAVILLIKGILFLFDWEPSYNYGDSEAYLATATLRYIPPDRSFMYGLLIRRIAFHMHSLEALICLQVTCSAVAAWLLCLALCKEFGARFWVAAVFGVLCAIEPLQLVTERYVMTEATATFLFVVHFVLLLVYLRRGKLWMLLLAEAVGILLIGIRISFLPEVLMNSILVPLLSPAAVDFYKSSAAKFRQRGLPLHLPSLRTVAIHLVLCLVLGQGLLTMYKRWYGRLMHREPALFYQNGAFLVCDFSPLIQPRDFPVPSRGEAILRRVTFNRMDLGYRLAQHFAPGGLWPSIQAEYPDEKQANEVAAAAATHAIRRDPLGAAEIGVESFFLYFRKKPMEGQLLVDEGYQRELAPDSKRILHTLYGVKEPKSYQLTLTKRWHLIWLPWYWLILCTLTAAPVFLFAAPRNRLPSMIVVVGSALVFLEGAVVTIDSPTARYLTTDSWLVLLIFGITAEALISRIRPSRTGEKERAIAPAEALP